MSVFTYPGEKAPRAPAVHGHVVAVGATPPPQMMQVTCPSGMHGGMQLKVRVPDGRTMQVTIPESIEGGMVFQVQVPPPEPVAVATVVAAPAPPQVAVPAATRAHMAAPQVHVVPGQAMPPPRAQAMRQCRNCGQPFAIEPGMNMCSADSFRCQRCRGGIHFSFF